MERRRRRPVPDGRAPRREIVPAALPRRHRRGGASDNRRWSVDARDRRLSFAVEFDQPCIKPQLRRAEANQFLEELEGLLLREAIEEPDEGDLVGKAKPVMRAPALAELHEIFLGQARGALELVTGKHYRCDTANAEVRKDGSLAYKITRICLVPFL